MMIRSRTRRSTKVWAVALGVALMALPALSGLLAGPAWADPAHQAQSEAERLKPLSGQEFEMEFMNAMIAHHQGALDMAKLVADRARHDELKTTAQQIIADQTREINDMTGWLQQWYNATPQHNMGNMNMGMGDMAKLEGLTGDAFDQEFLTQMRMHHQSAVEMAQLIPDRATHVELKTLGQNIIRTQTAEIQQFETWLKTWYNMDVTGGSMAGGAMPGGATAGDTMPRTGAGDTDPSGGWILALAVISIVAGVLLTRRNWGRRRA